MVDYSSKFWTKSYDKHVKPSLTYPKEGLGKIFAESMQRLPDKIACHFMSRSIPFSEMFDYVQRFATYMQKNGLKKGDVVIINVPNSPQYLIAHFGTLLAGGVCSGMSALLSEDETAYQIKDSGAKFIVTLDKIHEKRLMNILQDLPKLESIITVALATYMGFGAIKVFLAKLLGKIPSGKSKPWPGKKVIKLQDVLATPIDVKDVEIDVEKDLAYLYYTGGTTGRPKGTELTHKNIIADLLQMQDWLEFKDTEIVASGFPMFHAAGIAVASTSTYLAATQVLIPDPRNTKHIINEIIDKRPTALVNVPTLYMMITNNPKCDTIPRDVLDGIEIYISGAAPFPVESIREFEQKMHAQNKFVEVYGMTETAPLITSNPRYGEKKIGTVGMPLQDTEIRLINVDTGADVEIGEPGEIICKGPQVCRGYHKKPEATAKTIDKDGWFHTGDVGIFDEDGYLKIVDRVKDMLIVSGFKVYSVHVEDVLTTHPNIDIVAIIGNKDPNRPGSEIVKAVVQLKEGVSPTDEVKEDIKKFAEEHLSNYEKPKIWEFRKELPLTMVGKVLKKELRE